MSEELFFMGRRAADVLKDEFPGSITVISTMYGFMAQNRRFYVNNESDDGVFPNRLFVDVEVDPLLDSKGFYCDAVQFDAPSKDNAMLTFYVLYGENHRYRFVEVGTASLHGNVQIISVPFGADSCIQTLFPVRKAM